MLMIYAAVFAGLFAAFLGAQAATPNTIPHQGRVAVANTNFDGIASFKFVLFQDSDSIHTNGGETALWANDDNTAVAFAEPSSSVSLPVTKGLYAVFLGDTALMTALPNSIAPADGTRLYLRIWFDGGVGVFEPFTPDLELSPVAMALVVPGNAMGNRTIASGPGAVAFGNQSLASGSYAATFGGVTFAPSAFETVFGRFNSLYTPVASNGWNTADRLFVIGNGVDTFNRANLMTIYKNGLMTYDGAIDAVGSVTTSNSFNYASPKVYKLQIPPHAFTYGAASMDNIEAKGGYLDFASAAATEAVAPVNLPDGAVITSVVVGFYDNDAAFDLTSTLDTGLRRRSFTSTTVQDVAALGFSSSGQSSSMKYETQTTITNATVSQAYQYFIWMLMVADGNSSNLRFYGIQITYTLDKVSQ